MKRKKREEKERVTAAVLSITARAKRREAAYSKTNAEAAPAENMEVDDGSKTAGEKNFEILSNPARVVRQQLKVVQVAENSNYTPLKDVSIGGIIIMRSVHSGQPEELVELVSAVEEEAEPEPPASFGYNEK